MSDLPGADRLSEIWQELRTASSYDERRALVADAICATSRLEAAVHEARSTAVRLLRCGANAPIDTIRRITEWGKDYQA